MKQTKEAALAILDAQMVKAELYAQYWIAQATTGVACQRAMCGANGLLTNEEKIKEALDTALNHIHRIEEIAHKKFELLTTVENKYEHNN